MIRPRLHPRAVGPAAPRPRSRRGEGEQLREEIVDAAEQLLIETGSEDAVSIRAIATAVGVSPPAIYLHFPDKETLVYAVCARQFALFDTALETAASEVDDPVEALRERGEAYVRFGLDHPEPYRIMFMGRAKTEDPNLGPGERAGAGAFSHLVDNVRAAIDQGALRAGLDPVEAAIYIWAGVHGITSLLISLAAFPWPDREQLVRNLCALQLRALEPT